MEVLRANVSVVQSLQIQTQTAGLNLLSGYNKDGKFAKQAVMDAFSITQSSLDIVKLLFSNIKPNHASLLKAFDDVEIFAADYANQLVAEGMPFREAYKQVGENLGSLAKQDPEKNIRAKKHLGATGNLGLDRLEAEIQGLATLPFWATSGMR
jgi:argininosuccinate lyase